MAGSANEDARGSGSIVVDSSEAGALPRWAALRAGDEPADAEPAAPLPAEKEPAEKEPAAVLPDREEPDVEGAAREGPAVDGQLTPMARKANAAHDTGAARRSQARAQADPGTREVTQTSLPILLPTLDHLYRIIQSFPQRGGLGDGNQAGEAPADVGRR